MCCSQRPPTCIINLVARERQSIQARGPSLPPAAAIEACNGNAYILPAFAALLRSPRAAAELLCRSESPKSNVAANTRIAAASPRKNEELIVSLRGYNMGSACCSCSSLHAGGCWPVDFNRCCSLVAFVAETNALLNTQSC